MITQKRLKEVLHYDPETGVFIWVNTKGSRAEKGDIAGSFGHGYVHIRIDGILYRAHRLARLYVDGCFPVSQIDHINHNRADNRICNLVDATDSSNRKNTSVRSDSKSGHHGISWHKRSGKWRAYITSNKKHIHLGLFKHLVDAVLARKSAEIEYCFHTNHGN